MSEHEKALEEALGQLHDLAIGKDVDVKRSQVELDLPDIAVLRRRFGYSQQEFATAFRVSVGTIRNWEQGRRVPRGPARVLLNVIAQRPEIVREALNEAAAS